ncbi:MAG: hypothetical protein ACPHUL_00370 [Marinomonas gallaica]
MGEAKFTKSEWRVEPFVNGNAYEIAYNDDGEVIAEYVYDLPDAHLIAAAPEMYDLLEKVKSAQELADNEIEHSDNLHELYDDIKKLLAKARGEG